MSNFISLFSRLSVHNHTYQNVRTIYATQNRNFKLTQELYAEPMKKKKKVDPQILKKREEKRRKKVEKQIRRLEKNARQLKPVDELEVPLNLIDERNKRLRPAVMLSPPQIENRILIQKSWTKFTASQHLQDVKEVDRIVMAQQRALDQLRQESEELYQEAIQPDMTLVPFKAKGTVATPPIKNYDSPDGEYIDVTKKWDN